MMDLYGTVNFGVRFIMSSVWNLILDDCVSSQQIARVASIIAHGAGHPQLLLAATRQAICGISNHDFPRGEEGPIAGYESNGLTPNG